LFWVQNTLQNDNNMNYIKDQILSVSGIYSFSGEKLRNLSKMKIT
jgi:hypothetical protein